MVLRGRIPLVHGFVVILKQCSAQAGSHSRNLAKAASQGPVSCHCSTRAFLEAGLLTRSPPIRCGHILQAQRAAHKTSAMIFPSTTFTGYEATPKSAVPAKHPVVTSNFIPCTGQVTILP